MNIYELEGEKYDVSKLDTEAQSIFHFLIHAKKKADEHREELFILTEAYTSLAKKLNERCDDDALVKEEDLPEFVPLIDKE